MRLFLNWLRRVRGIELAAARSDTEDPYKALILARAACRRERPAREACGHSAPEAERVFHLQEVAG
jgi:hypothetical protein